MNGAKVKVLIIDDDPDFVQSSGIVLKTAGYEVVEALSGKEGLEKSNSHKPDLYIIDLMMETYSEGANVVRALVENEETRDKPRIMITSVDLKGPWAAHSQDDSLACDFILQKPVAPAELLDYVNRALKQQ
ncbi:MAG: response regulator [Deltaproteobacteria bacterium]|nr:response regulator [Deltaproteobacteria bacterium]MBW1816668.1 response regulator [Deltaproteobacteria bacterium]